MRVAAIFSLLLISIKSWSSEVIVCFPLELSFDGVTAEMSVKAKTNDLLPEGYSGILCNSERSWCQEVELKNNIKSKVSVSKANISSSMLWFQSYYYVENNHGGCKWPVSM